VLAIPPGKVVQPTHWTMRFCRIALTSLCNPYKFWE
jgi:hypothetical protein